MTDDQKLHQALGLICRDNIPALRYLQLLARAARLMDDAVDGDHGPVPWDELFHLLLVELPLDPFFQTYRHWLIPAHTVALNAWHDANTWERSETPLHRHYAHVIRDTLTEVGLLVALLVGGREHQRAVSLPVRELFLKPLTPE